MGNTSSVAGRECFMAAVGGDPNLAVFRGDLLYEFHALPSYNLAVPVIPQVITFPKTATQVAEIVRCASGENYHVQAHSGGHSYGNYGMKACKSEDSSFANSGVPSQAWEESTAMWLST